MVEMPTDQFTFIGIRFLLNGIINDQHTIGMLDLTNGGLDNLPEVSGSELALGEEARHLVVADRAIYQAGKASSRCGSK